jgi:hypothetical protein
MTLLFQIEIESQPQYIRMEEEENSTAHSSNLTNTTTM